MYLYVEDEERSGAPKKFKDEKLVALLDEDSCQIIAELGESLGVDYTTLFERFKTLRIIQRQGLHWKFS